MLQLDDLKNTSFWRGVQFVIAPGIVQSPVSLAARHVIDWRTTFQFPMSVQSTPERGMKKIQPAAFFAFHIHH